MDININGLFTATLPKNKKIRIRLGKSTFQLNKETGLLEEIDDLIQPETQSMKQELIKRSSPKMVKSDKEPKKKGVQVKNEAVDIPPPLLARDSTLENIQNINYDTEESEENVTKPTKGKNVPKIKIKNPPPKAEPKRPRDIKIVNSNRASYGSINGSNHNFKTVSFGDPEGDSLKHDSDLFPASKKLKRTQTPYISKTR